MGRLHDWSDIKRGIRTSKDAQICERCGVAETAGFNYFSDSNAGQHNAG